MSVRMWGQVVVQATMPAEAPVMLGTLWADTSAEQLKQCTSVSPYTFVTIGGTGGGSGSGDVVGPASADDRAIAFYDGTTGKLITDLGILDTDLVLTNRQVVSGAGLTGGGDLSANRTLAVGAGTGITVNADDVAVNQAALKLDDFATPDDNTDLNASGTAHGLLKKLSLLPNQFMDGTGNWDDVTDFDLSTSDTTTGNANTSKHGFAPKAVAPASGLLSVLAIGNGATVRSDTAIFDTTNPAALGTAAPGTALVAARRDHVHAIPTNALLDGSAHSDTVVQGVTRGSLIYGNSTPKWDELVIGSTNSVLVCNGTDAAWSTGPTVGSLTATGALIADSPTFFIDTTNHVVSVGSVTPSSSSKFYVHQGTDQNFSLRGPLSGATRMLFEVFNDAASANIGMELRGAPVYVPPNFQTGLGTITPAASAALDISSTTGALLVPRMTTTQKNALTGVNGMIVYDSSLDKFQGYQAGVWTNLI